MAARDSGIRQRQKPRQARNANVRLVPMRPQAGAQGGRVADKNATFGQRRTARPSKGKGSASAADVRFAPDGGVEMTYVPSMEGAPDEYDDRRGAKGSSAKGPSRRKGVEQFGAGMEKGGEDPDVAMSESERKGRTQRRKGMRSGSKNTFRRM